MVVLAWGSYLHRNCLLCGVNFYAYIVSGYDLLSVIRGSGVSVREGLPIYGFSMAKQSGHKNLSVISRCPLWRGVG